MHDHHEGHSPYSHGGSRHGLAEHDAMAISTRGCACWRRRHRIHRPRAVLTNPTQHRERDNIMTMRRQSRTPAVLTRDQQEYLVKTAETNPALLEKLERFTKTEWSKLTFQQKVKAIGDMQEEGYALGSLAGALRGIDDFDHELDKRDFGLEVNDRLLMLEQENSELRETVADLRRQLGTAETEATPRKRAAKKTASR